jgi:hypothetical protein
MKKLVPVLVGLAVIIALVVAGCSSGGKAVPPAYTTQAASTQNAYDSGKLYPPTPTIPPTTTAPTIRHSYGLDVGNSESSFDYVISPQSPVERMVVKTGNMQVVVRDVTSAMDKVAQIANSVGGYVVSAQKWKEGEKVAGSIAIRVPSIRYDETIVNIRNLAMDVLNENTTSQDVTQEYVDLGSRLKNLEATEAQLLKIMESATKTEDILAVQRELTSVRGDIEQIKGRMLYLEQTSAMSLITVQFSEAQLVVKINANKARVKTGEEITFNAEVTGGFAPYSYEWNFGDGETSNQRSPVHFYREAGTYTVSLTVTDDKGYSNTETRKDYIFVTGGWGPGATVASAWNGFLSFGRVVLNILIWLGIFSPVWLIVGGLIAWGVYRRRRKAGA